MNKLYNYEIYITNSVTGNGGWDIKFVTVLAPNPTLARAVLKTFPYFDEIILCNIAGAPIDSIDAAREAAGMLMYETDHDFNPLPLTPQARKK